VSDGDAKRVVEAVKAAGIEPEYDESVTERQNVNFISGGTNFNEDGDELLGDAKEVILQAGKASASLLQRRLKIGYARAARILDLLEKQGFIGPGEGAKPRDVLTANAAPPLEIEKTQEENTAEEEF
jgi:S-DNA-T family DNA segregation ATPase FtsK/SpoIIIE